MTRPISCSHPKTPPALTTYSYDADGNRTCQDAPSETIYYTWDEDSRLTVVEPPAGKTTLTYRGDGRRVQKETPTRHDQVHLRRPPAAGRDRRRGRARSASTRPRSSSGATW